MRTKQLPEYVDPTALETRLDENGLSIMVQSMFGFRPPISEIWRNTAYVSTSIVRKLHHRLFDNRSRSDEPKRQNFPKQTWFWLPDH